MRWRMKTDENGDEVFESIDDEDELQDVYERFMVLLYDDEEDETWTWILLLCACNPVGFHGP